MMNSLPFRVLLAIKRSFLVARIILAEQGYSRSVVTGRPVDGDGSPIPWFTYPAIEYLKQFDFSGKRVFEYGSGNSSLFWAARSASVIAVESSEEWHRNVSAMAPSNLEVRLHTDRDGYVNSIAAGSDSFDIIVVDGKWRNACVRACEPFLSDAGFIIIDNSDRHYRACDELRDKGYFQIDFSGCSPINRYASTTSLLLKRPLDQRTGYSQSSPVAGLAALAGDDD
jgi:hypothetical protein